MAATARTLSPTPTGPVASPGRRDATGPTHGAGLTLVEGPGWATRLDQAAAAARVRAPSQLAGELALMGIVGEGLAWPICGGGLGWSLANVVGLVAWIGGSLAHAEHAKRSRIAARTERVPARAG